MEVLAHHRYIVIMRAGGSQRVGQCLNLRVRELSPEESSQYEAVMGVGASALTHAIAFRDAEYLRTYVGWMKEDSEKRLIFDLGEGKEYEFRPMGAPVL